MLLIPILSNSQDTEVGVTLEFDNAPSNLELVQNYAKALQAGDVTAMNAQLADNAMVYGLGGGMDSLNVAEHKEYYTNSTTNYNHVVTQDLYLPVKVSNNWNEGEWVLSWGTNTITNKKTGKAIPIPYHTASLVDNGKIVMIRYYYDMLNILQAEGMKFTPPAE
ncbi:MAG TPA: nuclear transport factor 2 family protein [Pricia sp.]|uniref:Nuclear transport factor 2 family protein n=1 Tax=Pricia antarctica TaxID=641691 RepID=A0A831QUF5_9FLAO|nr:nuclear transport factor 2 family protein [Pricia sp.]HEA22791.1 nuclear transport factor 2 family protein [Pricia antarctica]